MELKLGMNKGEALVNIVVAMVMTFHLLAN